MKLNKDQRKQLAEIFANIAVAWFAGGIIAQIYLINQGLEGSITSFAISLLLSIISIIISLKLLSGRKRR